MLFERRWLKKPLSPPSSRAISSPRRHRPPALSFRALPRRQAAGLTGQKESKMHGQTVDSGVTRELDLKLPHLSPKVPVAKAQQPAEAPSCSGRPSAPNGHCKLAGAECVGVVEAQAVADIRLRLRVFRPWPRRSVRHCRVHC